MVKRQFATGLLCLAAILEASSGGARTRAAIAVQDLVVIAGEVRDRAGQVLPGVTVTILPDGGGRTTYTTTDRDGRYHLDGLPDGTYRIDFELPGFSGIRRNHVVVGRDGSARVDAVISVRPQCECLSSGFKTVPRDVFGQVVDEAGRPLPHARLEVAGPKRWEIAYADAEGRFRFRPPVEGTWPIVASDGGFAPARQQISSATTGPLVLQLRFLGTQGLPDTEFNTECDCPEYFAR